MKVYHLDLNSRGGSSGGGGDSSGSNVLYASPDGTQELQQPPWFEGFTLRAATSATAETMAAVVTIGHPIRRLLSYFVEVDTSLEESLAWMDGEGERLSLLQRFFDGSIYTRARTHSSGIPGTRKRWHTSATGTDHPTCKKDGLFFGLSVAQLAVGERVPHKYRMHLAEETPSVLSSPPLPTLRFGADVTFGARFCWARHFPRQAPLPTRPTTSDGATRLWTTTWSVY